MTKRKNNGENTTFDKLTPERRREIQSKGGKARGEACRRRKALKQVVLDLLDHPAVTESGKPLIKLPDGEVPESLKAAIAASLIRQAMSGNVKAAKLVMEWSGEAEVKAEVENNITINVSES